MKRVVLAMLLCAVGQVAMAVDTDGDGLLDLLDVPGFDPNASGQVRFGRSGIQDLDGARQLVNATWLLVYDNPLTSIESGDFDGMPNLEYLGLFNNQLTTIESGAFVGLVNLQDLGLSGNRLYSIESGDFDGMPNLEYLGLSNNQLTTIESGDFFGLDNLQTLHLDGNQITGIESHAFDGLTNLQRLNLYNNQLTSVEGGDFDGLPNLQSLWLHENQLANIESGDFDGLASLHELNLSSNQIGTIQVGSFAQLTDLQRLVIDDNSINHIGRGMFEGLSNLQELSLYGNLVETIDNGTFNDFANLQTLGITVDAELNLIGARFDQLGSCLRFDEGVTTGLCFGSNAPLTVKLDAAVLSLGSFEAIANGIVSRRPPGRIVPVPDISLVNLTFSDGYPAKMNIILGNSTTTHVTVDPSLYSRYAAEFDAWAAQDGKTLSIVEIEDLNRDGAVDASDAGIFFAEWGEAPYGYSIADFNDDSFVDAADAGMLFAKWTGDSGSPVSVPEPATHVLALAAVVVVLQVRRTQQHCHSMG